MSAFNDLAGWGETGIYSRTSEVFCPMFDSLDERMKHELGGESTPKERIIRYGLIAAISLAVIVGLYEAVRLLG